MVVVVLTDCPTKLRGDLSKWLFEVNTGVYVGNVSARVRELLWERICDNVKNGQATMAFSSKGEQKLDFYVHNTSWEVVDYDGIKLMRRPLKKHRDSEHSDECISECSEGFSKAALFEKTKRIQIAKEKALKCNDDYVVLDIETTGLSHLTDEIIEIGALRVKEGEIVSELNSLACCSASLSEMVTGLTGITDDELAQHGRPLKEVLIELNEFIADRLLVCHNSSFDLNFIQAACRRLGIDVPRNPCVDTLALARRKLKGVKDYKLETIAQKLSIDTHGCHRALRDCYITNGIYIKLNEM